MPARARNLATLHLALTLLLGTGCGHSAPFAATGNLTEDPFEAGQPTRLTFAPGPNQRPSVSEDGRYLVYSLQFPDSVVEHDSNRSPDLCLGVLPASGGQRVATLCPGPSESPSTILPERGGIEHGALSATGRLAYVLHRGYNGGFSSNEGALWVAEIGDPSSPRKVMELKRTPPGALGRWDYLLDLTWDGPDQLVALAARADLLQPVPFADPDTVFVGSEIVRLSLTDGEPSWTRVAEAEGASAMAWDRVAQTGYYIVGSSVFRAGEAAPIYTSPLPVAPDVVPIPGIAVAAGQLLVVEQARDTASGIVFSRVVRVLHPSLSPEVLFGSSGGESFSRIALSLDGRRLYYESHDGEARTIFVQDLF